MGQTISKLSIVLSAEAGQLISGFKEAEAETASFQERLSQAGEKVSGALEAIGITLSAEAFGEWIHGAMEAAEKTEHLADSLGMTTEAMSRLGFAGKMVDVSQDEIGQAMAHMSRSLSEAASGSGQAAKSLNDLGLSASALMNMAPDEAFGKLADALDSVHGSMRRLADAQEIFGRGAVSLMPLISKGSDGLREMADQSDRLGYTLSESESKELEQANESIKQMSASFEAMGKSIAVDLAPTIQSLNENMSGLVDILRLGEVAVDGLRGSMAYLLGFVGALPRLLGYLGEHISHAFGASGLEAQFVKLKTYVDAIGQVGNEAFKSAGDTWNKIGQSVSHAGSASVAAASAAGQHTAAIDKLGEAAEHTAKRIDTMLESLRLEAATFGASDGQKKISELANAGASSDQLAMAHAYADLLEQMRQQKKLSDEIAADDAKNAEAMMSDLDRLTAKWEKLGLSGKAATDQALKDLKAKFDQEQKQQADKIEQDLRRQAQSIWEETRTPLEKAQEKVEELQKLLSGGFINLDTWNREIAKVNADLDKATQKAADSHSMAAPSLVEGSVEAANYIANFKAGYGDRDNAAVLQQQQQMTLSLQEVISLLRSLPGAIGVNFPIVGGF